ncbi:phosphoglycerate mutase-like protein [Janthinobacterium sp. HH01]|uniref:histidine phosphatase family protein n=1 Tax=Janthinobacterium sp. HH01 TaxID=1198452 RepID=UPI0002AE8347|nr:histidine phosphatase family protein [Janthinobacterium sp. HH01]ELX12859.1 phosphoglycerate mutase-like protein [Janthinobacterium sp. HH01]
MGQIYLVRHGQASFGSANYDQLSTLGYEQARLLGQWYANSRQSFRRVVVGGMARHRQTADTCLAELPKPQLADAEWITDDGFAEFDHHEVLRRHCPEAVDAEAFHQLLARHEEPQRALEHLFRAAMQRWMSGWHDDEYTETWPEFRRRCVAALERLDTDSSKQTTIVFTSGGVIATLMQHLLGLQDYQVMELSWSLANCAVTKLLQRPGQFTLSYLNNYAHLEWLGQAGAVTYR